MTTLARTVPDLSKLEALDGSNYKRWSLRMLIFLEHLEVDGMLYNDPPTELSGIPASSSEASMDIGDKNTSTEALSSTDTQRYERNNRTARIHILSHLSNPIFDLVAHTKSAKVIWETLLKKYGGEDAGRKRYAVGNWLNFKMVDNLPIMDQVHQFESLTADVLVDGMNICSMF